MSDLEKTLRPVDHGADKTERPGTRAEKTTRGNPENVEKTIRGGDNEAEKTMRPVDKTTRGEAIAEKTTRGAVMTEKTMRGDTGKTTHPNRQEEIDKVVRQIGQQAEQTVFLLDNINYKVVKPLSESTGEADVYLVANGEGQFALKLYKAGIEPDKDIIEIVRKNSGNPAINFLVDTLHHGWWTNPKTGQSHYYELMAYCTGGSLDQITISHNAEGEQLLGEIAIKCAACLDFLHSKQVIHRDIKPANFFFRNKGNKVEDLSLADFGIAIRCDENGEAKVRIQMRTKIYAAPEYYVTIDDSIAITKSMDFYSLGIMLLVLWEGGEERYRALGERFLWTLKQDNKLPYPQDMPPRLWQLAKALTIADPEKRAGFEEVVKWAKGEDIYNKEDLQFNIVYNASKKQIAKSREELVKFMMEDQKLATTYLYRGQISAWLKEINFTELSTPLDEITETQFPKNKEAGFWAACYFLDPNLKYLDINHRAIEENEEIAATLRENFDYYSQALADKNHKLFIYLNATGRGEVNKLAPLFKKGKDNRDATLQLIYALDPSLPWRMIDDNGNKADCQTADEVIQNSFNPDFPLSDESADDLITEAFLVWIGTRDKALEGKIRSEGHDKDLWALLYNLNPKLSYDFQFDENSDSYFFTAAEIGNYMNIMMENYIQDEDSFASAQLDMMCHINDTRLYHYFKSKGGVYDDKIDWIQYCGDVKSKENTRKAGPYNWKIGVYKAIKGLGFDPYYYFPKSDKYVYTLGELDQIPDNEKKEELAKGYLEAWLTTLFQEDPALDLSPQFAYETATDAYMEKLEEIDEEHEDVENYRLATDSVEVSVLDLKRKYRVNLLSKSIIVPLTLIAAAAVIYGLLNLDIPKERNFHSTWIYAVAVLMGIVAVVYTIYDISNDLGCVGILLVGALAGVVTYFGLLFIAPYLVYLITAIVAAMAVMMVVRLVKSPVSKRANSDLFYPSTEERILEPLHFTFRAAAGTNFKSSIGERTSDLTWDIGENTKAFYKKLLVPWISIILLGVISFGVLGSFDTSRISAVFSMKKSGNQQQYSVLQGEWEGTFDGRDAVMQISKAQKEAVEATITVKYRELITENVTGAINMEDKTLHLDDVHANGNLDGEYNGKFNDDFTEMSGTYQNYTTKKQVPFRFVKSAAGSNDPVSETN